MSNYNRKKSKNKDDYDDYGGYDDDLAEVMSIGDWLITFLLLAIPLVNLVMLIYWAANDSTNPNKANFARAYFIVIGICIGLIILLAIVGAVFGQ